jgi:hypothetical protein
VLGETAKNPTSLLALQSTINPTLIRPDPLASHHIATIRMWHEVPRLVGKKSQVLLFHRTTSVRICQCFADKRRYQRESRLSLSGGESLGPKVPIRMPSHHGMSVTRIPMDDRRVAHGRLHTRATWWRRWWRRRSQGAHSVREPSG